MNVAKFSNIFVSYVLVSIAILQFSDHIYIQSPSYSAGLDFVLVVKDRVVWLLSPLGYSGYVIFSVITMKLYVFDLYSHGVSILSLVCWISFIMFFHSQIFIYVYLNIYRK